MLMTRESQSQRMTSSLARLGRPLLNNDSSVQIGVRQSVKRNRPLWLHLAPTPPSTKGRVYALDYSMLGHFATVVLTSQRLDERTRRTEMMPAGEPHKRPRGARTRLLLAEPQADTAGESGSYPEESCCAYMGWKEIGSSACAEMTTREEPI